MKVMTAVAVLGASVLIAGLTAVPASAASVDKDTFLPQFRAAAQMALPDNSPFAHLVKMSLTQTQSGQTQTGTALGTVNPNGSYIMTATQDGVKATVKCVTATKCWGTADNGKTWQKQAGNGDGPEVVDFNADLGTGPTATFDITGNTYTITEEGTTLVVTFAPGHIVMTGDANPLDGSSMHVDYEVVSVSPIVVKAPPKSRITKPVPQPYE